MFIRVYCRASAQDQNAFRAKDTLTQFAASHGHKVAAYYIENASGAKLDRLELFRLLDDSHEGDVMLIEDVSRLSRLTQEEWATLKTKIAAKKVTIVSLDLVTSHTVLLPATKTDDFTRGMIAAINGMLLDMLAVIARKDYEDRRTKQASGIKNARDAGVYKGRPVDEELRARISVLLKDGKSVRAIASLLKCSTTTVQRAKSKPVSPV